MTHTTISKAAEDSRERARQRTGEFGTQGHAESGLVDAPTTTSAERIWGINPEINWGYASNLACVMAGSRDEYELMAWADGRLDQVDKDQITLAFATFADDARAERDGFDASDPDATFERVDERFAKVTAEAVRRHAAMEAITGRAIRTGDHETTGAKYDGSQWDAAQIARSDRADLKSAYDEQLLPAGTTTRVRTRKFAGGQAIDLTLCGIPDDQVTSELTLPNGMVITERTPYVQALDRTWVASSTPTTGRTSTR